MNRRIRYTYVFWIKHIFLIFFRRGSLQDMTNINSLSTYRRPHPLPAKLGRSASPQRPAHRRWLFHPEALPQDARQALFIAAAAFCLTPWVSPPLALALGAILALTHENPFAHLGKKVSAKLLQVCVVFLGFGMDLPVVLRTGLQGAGFAAATIKPVRRTTGKSMPKPRKT